jgi:hypothetical protein
MTTKAAETAPQTLEVAELDLERLPLSEVSPHEANPRLHSPEQIKAIEQSLIMDGYIAGSMGIQRSTRTLYKGHGVYQALLNLGCYEADFVVKDLTDAETLALLARDNALSDMSGNDPVKLKAISVNLQEMNVPIQRMGYTLRQIDSMQAVLPQSPEELWEGMPEFEQDDKLPYQQIIIRFDSEEDVRDFATMINRTITPKTKYLNIPKSNKYGYNREIHYGE